jgi:elongation factor 1-gamma
VFTSLTINICHWNRKPYQNANRWFTTVVNQPQFKAVIGEFKLCEKMTEFDPKKFADFQGMFFFLNIF